MAGHRRMATVLTTDGDQRAALAIVRSLGMRGHRVYVCSTRQRSLAGASRYARGEAAIPDPMRDPAGFRRGIEQLLRRWNADVLIPVTDAALLSVSSDPPRDGVVVPFPPSHIVRATADKALVLATAATLGIPVPRQFVLARPPAQVTAGDLRFPLVVKPTRSVTAVDHGYRQFRVAHAPDLASLERALERFAPQAYPVLVQERIAGAGMGVSFLIWDGKLVAAFAHRRLREKPPAGGVSVYCESVALDPAVMEASRKLLHALGWRGVAMVEYRCEARTGTPYLMEVNGRFWGSLQLALDAGVDFPGLLLDAAQGRRPSSVTEYTVGARSRWLWGDVDHLVLRLARSGGALALGADAPSRWTALRDFFRLTPRDRFEALQARDWRPFWRETIDRLRPWGGG